MRRSRVHSVVWVVVFAVLFVLFIFRAVPLTLDPMRTANAPDQFDTTRAIERLGKILDGTPHPVDSAPLDAVRSRLLQEIVTLGYQPQIKATSTCRGSISGSSIRCALVQNIYFTAGPKTGPALILTVRGAGGTHAVIHPEIPVIDNISYLIGDTGHPARLMHQRLCGWIDPGKSGRVELDTLCGYVWPGQATNPNTLKTRRQAARRALPELAALGWAVSEYAKNKFEIGRPKATHLLGPAPKTQEISHEK